MPDDCNGITSLMTPGYDYVSQVRCVNCKKYSIKKYGPGMEYKPCPHCGYAIGIHEKPVENQTRLGEF